MKQIRIITTNEAKQEYWHEQITDAAPQEDCMHVVNVYPQARYQTMEGFGGAFTEAAAFCYDKLSEAGKKKVLEGYFSEQGLKYCKGRISMNSCDFGLGNYCYVEDGDDQLKTFSVEHDKKLIIPMLKDAMTYQGNLEFLMSPWSPPAFMKTNGEMNHGGQLKKEYYAAWAAYFVRFIKEYRELGINITKLTIQNEPAATQTWDSCIYSAQEEGTFVHVYLANALKEAGLSDVEIYVWDHNKEAAVDRAQESLKEAPKEITGIAVHWYTGDHFDGISILRELYPDKKIIFSEGCVEYSRFGDSGETYKAEMYAHDMLGNLKAGITEWYDWNLLLDGKGGPNHVGNFCAAPMMCGLDFEDVFKHLSYYYIGQCSRYIMPGAVQIGTTVYNDRLQCVAFENPDQSTALVILNREDQAYPVTVRLRGEGVAAVEVAAHSMVTVCM